MEFFRQNQCDRDVNLLRVSLMAVTYLYQMNLMLSSFTQHVFKMYAKKYGVLMIPFMLDDIPVYGVDPGFLLTYIAYMSKRKHISPPRHNLLC